MENNYDIENKRAYLKRLEQRKHRKIDIHSIQFIQREGSKPLTDKQKQVIVDERIRRNPDFAADLPCPLIIVRQGEIESSNSD